MFLKNLHWFYLSRFMRVTPLMAVVVLLQASYFNRITDGPHWVAVIHHTENCRQNWWSTLLHIQNLVHLENMCISHSWYVAIDFQLYLVSPIILIWVMSGKKYLAWMGVVGGLAAVLIASTIYCFHINMPTASFVPTRFEDRFDYMLKYYFNTLARASPFFVGLVFGYILHIYRKSRIQMPWILAIFFWACAAGILGGNIYFKYRVMQFDWDNQLMDNLMNSFMRPSYACAICWLIIACEHGYSGPINWFLSLEELRLPARLSYGMYLFHYPLMYSLNAAALAPTYFSVGSFTFKFLSYLVLALVYSFVLTLLVDSPVTVLFKQLMESAKKTKPAVIGSKTTKVDDFDKNGKVVADYKDKKDEDTNDNNLKSNGIKEPQDFKANSISNGVLEKSDTNQIVDVNITSKSVPENR